MDSVLSFIQKNPKLIEKLPSQIQTAFEKAIVNSGSQVVENLASSIDGPVIETQQVISNSVDISKDILLNQRNIIIFVIIAWVSFLIIHRFSTTDEKKKDDFYFVHKILVGDIGVIPLLVIVWLLILITVSTVPILVETLPKISEMLKSITVSFLK